MHLALASFKSSLARALLIVSTCQMKRCRAVTLLLQAGMVSQLSYWPFWYLYPWPPQSWLPVPCTTLLLRLSFSGRLCVVLLCCQCCKSPSVAIPAAWIARGSQETLLMLSLVVYPPPQTRLSDVSMMCAAFGEMTPFLWTQADNEDQ